MAKGGGLTQIDMNLCSEGGLWYNGWAAEGVSDADKHGVGAGFVTSSRRQ